MGKHHPISLQIHLDIAQPNQSLMRYKHVLDQLLLPCVSANLRSAIDIKPSFWLLAFSMFIFLSLAMVKRYSELLITLQANKNEPAGRGYTVNDLPVLMVIGVSAGLGLVLIFALYINSPDANQMYQHTIWLWLVPSILLYWVSRMWMKAHRGQVDG